MNERLKEFRKIIFPKSAADFAASLGIEYRTYAAYERGERKISAELIKQLVLEHNLNVVWLFTGTGNMFMPEVTNSFQPKDNEKILKNFEFLGYRLSHVQDELGYLDKAMARIMGIDEKQYMQIKLGKEDVTVEQLARLASKVDVSLDWLIKGDT